MALNRWMQCAADLDSNNIRQSLLPSITNLLNCPCGMLGNQWLRVACRAFQRRKVAWIAHITERDTDIT